MYLSRNHGAGKGELESRGKLSRSTKKRFLQHHTFIDQSIAALAIYVPSLLVTAVLINLKKGWNYSDRIVLNNEQFNANLIKHSPRATKSPLWGVFGAPEGGCGGGGAVINQFGLYLQIFNCCSVWPGPF